MSFPRSPAESAGMHGSHPVFNRFWRHYDASMEWLRLHLAVMNEVSADYEAADHGSRGAPKRRKFPCDDHQARATMRGYPEFDDDVETEQKPTEDREEDPAISEEVLNFFEASRKHREARDREVSERKYENLENLMLTSRESAINVGADTSEVFERRLKHLRELYGSEWTKIHGMEMALQSGFDRFTSHSDVRLWPNIPIKIRLNY
ncbi:gem-associated protein 8-like [Galendromus occidentalis]|uniref:Gem-associated protein 8-like n=1 Tax=Galendromus occidentalis TaxID=34638 RepID=A0AAJ6QXS8_9ACAR|nr:gem-associated protein 8-like [Galendromus occidentalis]